MHTGSVLEQSQRLRQELFSHRTPPLVALVFPWSSISSFLLCVHLGPLSRCVDGFLLIFLRIVSAEAFWPGVLAKSDLSLTYLPLLSHSLVQRILRVRRAQQSLYAEQDCPYLQRRGPIILEHIQAYPAQAIDIGVVDAGEEAYSWRTHGVVVGEEELEVEDTACSGSAML